MLQRIPMIEKFNFIKLNQTVLKKGFVTILERKVGLRTKDLKILDIKPKAYLENKQKLQVETG